MQKVCLRNVLPLSWSQLSPFLVVTHPVVTGAPGLCLVKETPTQQSPETESWNPRTETEMSASRPARSYTRRARFSAFVRQDASPSEDFWIGRLEHHFLEPECVGDLGRYIKNYGPEVNLFVDHSQIVQLECLRPGIWGTKSLCGTSVRQVVTMPAIPSDSTMIMYDPASR